jgi:hypothetical protein
MEATLNGKDGGKASRADIWRDRIDAQRASGQSVRAWCQANDSREHSFYWWRARLGLSPEKRKASPRPRRRPVKPIAFARVVVNASSTTEPLRLRLAGQRELIFPASMPVEQVAGLVHAIEGKPSMIEGGGECGGQALHACRAMA